MRGLGLDLLEVDRFVRLLSREHFMRRVFSDYERAHIARRRGHPAETAAGLFCAKEAYGKALGTGISGLRLCDVEVRHTSGGQPVLYHNGNAVAGAHLSITHTARTAAAVVVLE